MGKTQGTAPFWSVAASELIQQLETTPQGLTSDQAAQRLERYGANLLKPKKQLHAIPLLLGQFKRPIIVLLLFTAGLSFFLHDPTDAVIIMTIILGDCKASGTRIRLVSCASRPLKH